MLRREGIEGAPYDSQAIRAFVGMDLARESAPGTTTLLKFCRLLKENRLTERIFAAIKTLLSVKGLLRKEGTVVNATIIATPARSGDAPVRTDCVHLCVHRAA